MQNRHKKNVRTYVQYTSTTTTTSIDKGGLLLLLLPPSQHFDRSASSLPAHAPLNPRLLFDAMRTARPKVLICLPNEQRVDARTSLDNDDGDGGDDDDAFILIARETTEGFFSLFSLFSFGLTLSRTAFSSLATYSPSLKEKQDIKIVSYFLR